MGPALVWQFLRADLARHLLTIGAVVCGVALLCAFDVADRGVLAAFGEVIDTMAGRAALQVTGAGATGIVPDEVAAELRLIRGVARVAPAIGGTAFLADGSGES